MTSVGAVSIQLELDRSRGQREDDSVKKKESKAINA